MQRFTRNTYEFVKQGLLQIQDEITKGERVCANRALKKSSGHWLQTRRHFSDTPMFGSATESDLNMEIQTEEQKSSRRKYRY